MEREIKFRAKAVNTEMWVYGDLVHNQKVTDKGLEPRVMVGGYEVYKDTVCQFTGLQDINQKDIYEGDIMRSQYGRMYYIKYDENSCSFLAVQFGDDIAYPYILLKDWIHLFGKMVIGNIYDNKDLLKESEVEK